MLLGKVLRKELRYLFHMVFMSDSLCISNKREYPNKILITVFIKFCCRFVNCVALGWFCTRFRLTLLAFMFCVCIFGQMIYLYFVDFMFCVQNRVNEYYLLWKSFVLPADLDILVCKKNSFLFNLRWIFFCWNIRWIIFLFANLN